MLSRVRGTAALHASIGAHFSFRPSLISPLLVRHRVMSSSTDFKQVRLILHLPNAVLFTLSLPGTS